MLGECMENIASCYLVSWLERVDRSVVNELLVIRVLNDVGLVVILDRLYSSMICVALGDLEKKEGEDC